ncbi:MAG: acylphosphatase, partial [Magnetococcales bacterium]|nr:acylphosphatase [Magnetococcales bacterium]
RLPAYVIGDGIHSIEQLIALKNVRRQSNPHDGAKLMKFTPMMARNLASLGMDGQSIPEAGRSVQLHTVANIGSGGESRDLSEQIHPGFAAIAARVRQAIHDPLHVGFDLIAEDIGLAPDAQNWTVIEVNTNPDFGVHHFHTHGTPRDVAGALLEVLFPDRNPEVPVKTIGVRISGMVQGVGFRKWVWQQAHLHALQGWVRNVGANQVEARFSGTPHGVDHLLELCRVGPKQARVSGLERLEVNETGFDGFVIQESV